MQPTNSLPRQILLAIFVVSGFTGLIYESIWSHYLKLFLGHAAYAQTLVLAIFMGGMALGSWIVAKYSIRLRQLLIGYVIVEGIIGLFGLVFHRLFVGATDWTFESVIPALSSDFAVHTFKWALAACLILPQSTLLGMTFPLISGGIIRRWPERPGETLSMLYFTNSIGAAVGVLVSGFVLIRLVGLPGTILTAGLLNVVLALAVWAIVKYSDAPEAPPAPPVSERAGRVRIWFLAAAFLTGAASFLYEIGWIRMLSLVLGSSTHSFELMLSAFIAGLAFGGLWMRRRIDRIENPARYLGFIMVAMGALALLTLPAYNLTFDFMASAMRTFTRTEGGYLGFNLVSQLIAMLIMVPTTFCAGMTLPLLTHALLKRGDGERAIGRIYAANTLGAIIGVLLAIHVLMPLFNVKGVVLAGAATHMILGLSGLVLLAQVHSMMRLAVGAACTALVAFALFGATLDPKRMTAAVYRTGNATQPQDDAQVLYLRDGKTATISLVAVRGEVVIATNGKPDAAIQVGPGPASLDEVTMVFAAALPLSMHPGPKRVANIGFGSGLTSHAVLASQRVQRLDSIEIEPLMVEAARRAFFERTRSVYEDPRSHVIYEDAKTFFATTREPYDIIISEPSNPWVSGVATLFSEEFYARVTDYLQPDGYLVQWLQIYETDLSVVASVLKAMSPHFGAYALYNTDDLNILIVAARDKTLPAPHESIFSSETMRRELARVGITSLADFEQRRIGDRHTLEPLFQSIPVPPNSDFFPFVDLNAARLRYMNRDARELSGLLTLPVPLVELLGARDQEAERRVPSEHSRLQRDAYVRQSLDIRDAIVNGGLNELEGAIARSILLLDASDQRCRDLFVRKAWLESVRQISDLTTPYLPRADVARLWERILGSACYRDVPGPHRDWATFLHAVARRDAAEIVKLGSALIATQDGIRAREQQAYLLMAVSAAHLRLGQGERAHALLEGEMGKLKSETVYAFPLRKLAALSRSRSVETVAHSQVLAP